MKTTFNFSNLRNRDYQDENRWRTSSPSLKMAANMSIIADVGLFAEMLRQFESDFHREHDADGKVPFTASWDWDEQLTQLFLDFQEEFNDLSESEEYGYFGDFCLAKFRATQAALDEGKTTFCDRCGGIVEKEHSVGVDGGQYCYGCALDEIKDKIKDCHADNN